MFLDCLIDVKHWSMDGELESTWYSRKDGDLCKIHCSRKKRFVTPGSSSTSTRDEPTGTASKEAGHGKEDEQGVISRAPCWKTQLRRPRSATRNDTSARP